MKKLIDELEQKHMLTKDKYITLLENFDEQTSVYLFAKSRALSQKIFGKKIYLRGLIEFTNYCVNDCYYCGIRCGNVKASRYRLTQEEIISCCALGYKLGLRTFVLQGGEDAYFTDDKLVSIIKGIKEKYPDCALTLSIGEKSYASYLKYFQAGADRFLLRHETANPQHYAQLHPHSLSLANRKRCLYDLKAIGYQTGTGFMVGSPWQTAANLADDLLFIQELQPEMIGIGPFIPHKDTPFTHFPAGSVKLTVFMLGLLRLMLPSVLLPATTALGTLDPQGREQAIMAGANVIMPNLSPVGVRSKYMLYNDKIHTNEEAAEGKAALEKLLHKIGYASVVDRGDHPLRT